MGLAGSAPSYNSRPLGSELPPRRRRPDHARMGVRGNGSNSMAAQSKEPAKGADSAESATLASLFSDFIWMASAFWASRQRNKLVALAGALVVVVGATAYMQIRLNSWNRPFYNALTNKDMPGFLSQLVIFGELAGILLVLNVAQMWLNQ